MITRDILLQAARQLADAGCDTPRLDAELLLAHAWNTDKTGLIIRAYDEVPDTTSAQFTCLLERRSNREPVAYILGCKEFWSREFSVDPRVLIPRPETEHLIEEILNCFPNQTTPWRFCDIGTGSGCIAVTLACEYPNAQIVATDISDGALAVASSNADRHHVSDRITFYQGDLLQALPDTTEAFDTIVSNPPYVSLAEMQALEPELQHEPQNALTDQKNGLHYLTRLLEESPRWLRTNGIIALETGLCGLPKTPPHLDFLHDYKDLAGIVRGGIYRKH